MAPKAVSKEPVGPAASRSRATDRSHKKATTSLSSSSALQAPRTSSAKPTEGHTASPEPISPPSSLQPVNDTTTTVTAIIPMATTVSADQENPSALSPHTRQTGGIDALGLTILTDFGSLSGTYNVSPNTPTPNIIDSRSPMSKRRRQNVGSPLLLSTSGFATADSAAAGDGDVAASTTEAARVADEVARCENLVSEPPSLSASGGASEIVHAEHRQRVRESRKAVVLTTTSNKASNAAADGTPSVGNSHTLEASLSKKVDKAGAADAHTSVTNPNEAAHLSDETERTKKVELSETAESTGARDKTEVKEGRNLPESENDAQPQPPVPAPARTCDKPWLSNAAPHRATTSHDDESVGNNHDHSIRSTSSANAVTKAQRPASRTDTSTTNNATATKPRRVRPSEGNGAQTRTRAAAPTTSSAPTGVGRTVERRSAASSIQNDWFASHAAESRRESASVTREETAPAARRTRRGITPTTYASSAKRRQQPSEREHAQPARQDAHGTAKIARPRHATGHASSGKMSHPKADGLPALHPIFVHLDSAPHNNNNSSSTVGADLHDRVVRSVNASLYEGIYTELATCEEEEVPPVFERPLSYYEQQLVRRHPTDAVAHYQAAMSKRKKALKKQTSLMPLTAYGGLAGGAPLDDLKHIARVVRYCLEEENWKTAVDAMQPYQLLCAKLLMPTYRAGDDVAAITHVEKENEETEGEGAGRLHKATSVSLSKCDGAGARASGDSADGIAAGPEQAPAAQDIALFSQSSSLSLQFRMEDQTPAHSTVPAAKTEEVKKAPSRTNILMSACTKAQHVKTSPASPTHKEVPSQASAAPVTPTLAAENNDNATHHSIGNRTSGRDVADTARAAAPPSRSRRRRRGAMPLPIAPVCVCPIMQLVSFSRFEVHEELKRMVWWCAAHRLSRFSIAVGVTAGADNVADLESPTGSRSALMMETPCIIRHPTASMRAPSPVLYSAAYPSHGAYRHGQSFSVFYDTVVLLLVTDKWLATRVALHSRSRVEGLITISLLPCVLEEARHNDWARFRHCGKPRLELYARQRPAGAVGVDEMPLSSFSRPGETSLGVSSSAAGVEDSERFTKMGSPMSRAGSPTRGRRSELPTASALSFFS